jgi:hypothetical protein
MNALLQLLKVQIQIKRNIFFNKKYAYIWFAILVIILPLLFVSTSSTLLSDIVSFYKQEILKNTNQFLVLVSIIIFIITFLYQYIFGVQLNIKYQFNSRALPVKEQIYIISDMIMGMFDFWTLFILFIFYTLCISLDLYHDLIQLCLSGFIFLSFYLIILLFINLILSALEIAGKITLSGILKRIYSAIIPTAFIAISVFFLIIIPLWKWNKFFDILGMNFIQISPFGLTSAALLHLAQNSGQWVTALVFNLVYIFMLFILKLKLSKANIYTLFEIKKNLFKAYNGVCSLEKGSYFSILIKREFLYLYRSTRIRIMFWTGIVFSYVYLSTSFSKSNEFSYLNIVLLSVPLIFFASESISPWLHEGAGAKLYFMSGVNLKHIIISKNLTFFLIILILECVNLAIGFWRNPGIMILDNIIFSIILSCGFYFYISIILNYLAFTFPKKVAMDTVFSKSMYAHSTLYLMLGIILFLILYSIPFLFKPFNTKLIYFFLSGLSLSLYLLSAKHIIPIILKNRESFVEIIS